MKSYNQNDKIALKRPGMFGQCQSQYTAKFMENLPIEGCVMTASQKPIMTAATCQSLSFPSFGGLEILLLRPVHSHELPVAMIGLYDGNLLFKTV